MVNVLQLMRVRLLVLGNGAVGAEKQALALGERLHRNLIQKLAQNRSNVLCPPVECVRVTLRNARLFPPLLQVFGARMTRNAHFGYQKQDISRLLSDQKPSRDFNVVIGCGRSTVALCAMMKHLEPKKTFNVQIQHPRVPFKWFDAVIVPRHDFPRGKRGVNNLFLTSGTVHDITLELLEKHGSEWLEEFNEKLRGRRTHFVWLVGGPCRGFKFMEQDVEKMVEEFGRGVPYDEDVAVLVTFSRRTPKKVQKMIRRGLETRFPVPGQLLIWEGNECRNPYYALLSTASCVVTTPDSISMTTEAIASGKPVFTIGVENCKGKFRRYHESLFQAKATAPFTADAVSALLENHDATSWGSAALDSEISTIVDTIAKDIHHAVEQIEVTT